MEKLLTIKEVSEILQVNERTVHRLLQAGKIPATRVGNQWRFVPSYLEEWLINGGENSPTENEAPDNSSSWEKEGRISGLFSRACTAGFKRIIF